MSLQRVMRLAGISALLLLVFQCAVRAETAVDLELVLAVDVSLSMDIEEQRLQRDGYVNAFRDPKVIEAIRSGLHGRIAVTYVEWAGSRIQSVVVPWRLLQTADDANDFADLLAKQPISRFTLTSISAAMIRSSLLFATNGFQGLRRVIDISGDGPNNSGLPVEAARDDVVKRGIIINGLALTLNDRGSEYSYFDIPALDKYYRDCVIGGTGAFALEVRSTSEFATAIRQKLLLEIAAAPLIAPARVVAVQLTSPEEKYDCLIGEKLWQQYLIDGFGE